MATKRLTKAQIMGELSAKWGVSRREAVEMYDQFVALVYREIKKCGEFVMPGMGKLMKKARPARMGRNPATGASIRIPAKTVVRFTVAKAAKEALL